MKESVTYQKILREGLAEGRAEGRADAARQILKRHAARFLGPPSAAVEARIEDIQDFARLEALIDRIHEVSSWEELIPEP